VIKQTIRARLFLLALLPAVLASGMLYFYFLTSQLQLIRDSLVEAGTSSAEYLAVASEWHLIANNQEELMRLTTRLLKRDDLSGIAMVIGKNWRIREGSFKGAPPPNTEHCLNDSPAPVLDQIDWDEPLLFCSPIAPNWLQVDDFDTGPTQAELGRVVIRMSADHYRQLHHEALAQATRLGLVLFLVMLAIAYRVADQIARPLVDLARLVGEVADGDLNRRSEVRGLGEIGDLQRGVNQMVEHLEANQHDLEARIQARTAELEQRNHELDEQRQLAQQASQAKSQFLAVMSHEIRTPISGALGMLELLGKTDLDRRQQLFFSNLSLEARALKALIDDILDFSRIEAGKMPIEAAPFSPEEVCNEVVGMLAPNAHRKGLDISLFIDPTTPGQVVGDAQRLRQVLTNLTSNAIKFTSKGRIWVELVRLDAPNGQARMRCTVHDTGIGMSEEQLQNIFDGFTQADTSTNRTHGGSGLGTTIAKRLVELMGGEIGVRSKSQEGSCFWFELSWPCLEEAPQKGPVRGRMELLERNPECAHATTSLLERAGWSVTVHTSSEGLKEALEQQKSDWVLLAENSNEPRHYPLAEWLSGHLQGLGTRLCHLIHFGSPIDTSLFDYTLYKPLQMEVVDEVFGDHAHDLPSTPSDQPDAELRRARVLIAEDSHINALALRNFVEMAGHEVEVVGDGHAVLARMRSGDYDLVFMDMRMPVLDGLEATRRWREEEPAGSHLPIIAITANATVEDRDLCLGSGMDDFLSKPVTPVQVSELITKWARS